MFDLLLDPVVLAVLAVFGLVLVFYAFYLNNLNRERANLPALTFAGFLRACGGRIVALLDEWVPVFKTRTGAHATISQGLSWVGLTIAAPRLELYVTAALGAALLYCWLRTMHGRKNVTQLFAPLPSGLMSPGAAMELAAAAPPPPPAEPNIVAPAEAIHRRPAENTAPKPRRRRKAMKKPSHRPAAKRPARKAKTKPSKRARR